MENWPLPVFRYHPDPRSTGSIDSTSGTCRCCGKARDFVYIASVYAAADLDCALCPWCIASGEAAAKFDCVFIDPGGIGAHGSFESVSDEVVEEISRRTPGFASWQSEVWWTHCGDAGAYLGPVGKKELDAIGPAAWAGFEATSAMVGEDLERLKTQLDRDQGPTAYLFRCRHCGAYGAPWDTH